LCGARPESILFGKELDDAQARREEQDDGERTREMIAPSVMGLGLLALLASGCGTATGAAVGAGSGAAIGAGTGYGAGKGALIGVGVGAAAGAIYDITKHEK
jgi:hypothetical protein